MKNFTIAFMGTNRQRADWLHATMDTLAIEMFGDFGYDTLSHDEKVQVLSELISSGIITLED